ncbi:MAG: hypothetical protein AB7H90_17650 [Alphaproteobacteria bacterium]
MAVFDSLGYARFLREGGVPPDQAETHAEAARRFAVADLVTRDDLDVFRREMDTKFDAQTLRITVRLGAMLAAGFGLMTAVIGLLIRLH